MAGRNTGARLTRCGRKLEVWNDEISREGSRVPPPGVRRDIEKTMLSFRETGRGAGKAVKRRRIIYLLILILSLFSLPTLFSETPRIILLDVEIQGTKRTNVRVVRTYLRLGEERYFSSLEELESYLDQKRQILWNQRVFRSVEYDYTVEYIEGDVTAVTGILELTDGWTLYPSPMYEYDSSRGHTVSMNVVDMNFFGTLGLGGVRVLYNEDNFRLQFVGKRIKIFGVPWRFNLEYEYLAEQQIENDLIILDYNFKTLRFAVGPTLPLAGSLSYTLYPGIDVPFEVEVLTGNLDRVTADKVIFQYNHSLNYRTADWNGNFPHGIDSRLGHTIRFPDGDYGVVNKIEPDLRLYWTRPPIGLRSRLYGFYMWGDEELLLGEYQRGIIDETLWGDTGFFFNFDFVFRMVKWNRVLEIQADLFSDFSAVRQAGTVFAPDDLSLTVGTGILLYFDALKGMVIRLGVGYDLTRMRFGEFYFGFEEFFEEND